MTRKKRQTASDRWWTEYQAYLQSDAWIDFRRQAIAAADHKCCDCGKRCPSYRLHVHHKHYRTLGHETLGDVCVLCIPCHEAAHGRPLTTAGREAAAIRKPTKARVTDPYRPVQRSRDQTAKRQRNVPGGRPW